LQFVLGGLCHDGWPPKRLNGTLYAGKPGDQVPGVRTHQSPYNVDCEPARFAIRFDEFVRERL
jgi:hypothetical protein